ncbi:heavy-metal-associated domain-containing protein [Acetivibrio saccincola]|jgi:Cu+-exporting ATPase|uniref:Copper-exporting P-type ATPase A n=1 Tax=Acetivibrio saccincola TaxID=1677857 RepID=A0A2K9E0Z5_9FIRM|nr:heavy metal-associated domain-containing protein [Acetivibrio saccincola]AUG56028.1 Copper-exporting P-type ATPase A [Acetivibrio saccincola]HOA96864.1 heavy metal-associated domain-containing protein [Acetivibrio saccincola]HQD27817.1 heavy metal-associated domain-containing protein [Acetivibrio saccincola]
METVAFNVPTLSCGACSDKIQENVKGIKGVTNSSVDLKSQQLKVEYNPSDISPEEIKNHISKMGYEVL